MNKMKVRESTFEILFSKQYILSQAIFSLILLSLVSVLPAQDQGLKEQTTECPIIEILACEFEWTGIKNLTVLNTQYDLF